MSKTIKEVGCMAISSIGRPVVLTSEQARKMAKIMSMPARPAKSASGKILVLSDRKLDPKKFK